MKVPIIDQPQVNQAALPGVRSELDYRGTNGEAVNRGLQQLGQGVSQLGEGASKLAEHVDSGLDAASAIDATNAETQYEHDINDVMHGKTVEAQQTDATRIAGVPGPDAASQATAATPKAPRPEQVPTEGILNAQGMKAVEASHHALDYLAQRRQEIGQGLSDRARAKFLRSSQSRFEANRVAVEDHTARQLQLVGAEGLKARTALALTDIANHSTLAASDEVAVQSQLQAVTDRIQAIGKSQGLPPEAIQAQVAEFQGKATETRLEQLLAAKNDRDAQTLLDREHALLGERAGHYQKLVTDLAERQGAGRTVRQLADDSRIKVDGVDSGLIDVAKLDGGVRKLPEAQQNEHLDAAASKARAMAEDSNRAVTANHFGSAFTAFLQGHSLADVDVKERQWLQAFDPEGWHRLEQIDHQWQTEQRARRGPKPDMVTPQDINFGKLTMDMAQHPDAYVGMPMDQFVRGWADKLHEKDFRAATSKLAEIQKEAGKPDKNPGLPTLGEKTLLRIGRENNLFGTSGNPATGQKASDDEMRIFGAASKQLAEFRTQYKATHGGSEPKQEDYEKAIAPMLMELPSKGMLYGSNPVKAIEYQTLPKYEGQRLVLDEDVPKEWDAAIRQKFQAKGIDPSPDQVKELYRETLRAQDRGKAKLTADLKVTPAGDTSSAETAPAAADPLQYDHPNVVRVLGPTKPASPAKPARPDAPAKPNKPNPPDKPSPGAKQAFDPMKELPSLFGGQGVDVPDQVATKAPAERKGKK